MVNQGKHWLDFVVEFNIEHFVYFKIHIDDLHKIECYWHLEGIKHTYSNKIEIQNLSK